MQIFARFEFGSLIECNFIAQWQIISFASLSKCDSDFCHPIDSRNWSVPKLFACFLSRYSPSEFDCVCQQWVSAETNTFLCIFKSDGQCYQYIRGARADVIGKCLEYFSPDCLMLRNFHFSRQSISGTHPSQRRRAESIALEAIYLI